MPSDIQPSGMNHLNKNGSASGDMNETIKDIREKSSGLRSDNSSTMRGGDNFSLVSALDERSNHLLNLSLNFSSFTTIPISSTSKNPILKVSLVSPIQLPSNILKEFTNQSTAIVSEIASEVGSFVTHGAFATSYEEPEIPIEAVRNYVKSVSLLKDIIRTHRKMKRKEELLELRMKAENLDKVLQNIPSLYFSTPIDKDLLIREIVDQQGRALNLYHEKLVFWLEQVEGLVTQRLRMDYLGIIEVLLKVYNLQSELDEILKEINATKAYVSNMQETFVNRKIVILNLARRKRNLDILNKTMSKIEKFNYYNDLLQSYEDKNQFKEYFDIFEITIETLRSLQGLTMFHGRMEELENRKKAFFDKMVSEYNRLINFPPLFASSKNLYRKAEETQEQIEDDPLAVAWNNDLLRVSLVFEDMGILSKNLNESISTFLENLKTQFTELTNSSLSLVQKGSPVDRENSRLSQDTPAHQLSQLDHQHFMFLLHQNLASTLQFLRQSLTIDNFFQTHFPQYIKTPLHVQVMNTLFPRLAVQFAMRSQFALQKYELIELSYKISSFQEMFLSTLWKSTSDTTTKVEETFKTFLQTQTKNHYNSFFDGLLKKLEAALESDTWSAMESIDTESNSISKCIIKLSSPDLDIYSSEIRAEILHSRSGDAFNASTPNTNESNHLNVASENFIVGKSFTILLKLIWEILEHATDPELSFLLNPEAVCGSLYQLLRIYNEKSKGLVLHAKAVKTVDIQRITAKHLVVCSESLHALIGFVPLIRKISTHIMNRTTLKNQNSHVLLLEYDSKSKNSILEGFDNLYVAIAEHRDQIVKKLESIMSKRLNITSESWKNLKWDSNDVTVPTKQMVSLLKDMAHLQKILSSLLSFHPEKLQRLFTPIITMYYSQLEICLRNITLNSVEGRRKLFDDISLIRKNVEKWKDSLSREFDTQRLEKVFQEIMRSSE